MDSYEYELCDFREKLIRSIASLFGVLDAFDTFTISCIHRLKSCSIVQ